MSHPELNQLTRAEQLFDAGRLDEALEILNDWIQFERLNSQQKSYYQFLKGLILLYQNKSKEVVKLGEEIFKEGQKLNDNLRSFDGLIFIIWGLGQAIKLDKTFKKIEKAEAALRLISNISKKTLIQREVRLSVLKGWINFYMGNIDLAEKCFKRTLSYQKVLGNIFEIVWANLIMAWIMWGVKSRYDLAIEYTKTAMSVAKEIKFNHFWIAFCDVGFGKIYKSIGEFNICLKHYMKSLTIYKEIKNDWFTSAVLNNIGITYTEIGDYDLALDYLEEGLKFRARDPIWIENCFGNIISAALKKGDIDLQ
jgi:tetratricopeptide (TPR) repeat protein